MLEIDLTTTTPDENLTQGWGGSGLDTKPINRFWYITISDIYNDI